MDKCKTKETILLKIVSLVLYGLISSFSYAETSVIIVTADKIEQPAEEIPSSLSILFSDELESQGVENLTSLARKTPSFSFQSTGQSGFNPPVIRGLTSYSTAFSSSMLMMVDGVPTLTNQGFENSLVGVERVEILRGPQSALYGKNAQGGVLNIYTRQPDNAPYLRIDGELGSRNKHVLKLDSAHPLLDDQLYFGISGQFREQDGFIDNRYQGGKADDRKSYDGRAVIRWTPNQNSDISLRYSQLNYRDGAARWGSIHAPRNEVRSGTPSWNHSEGKTFSLDLNHQFDSGVTLRSITAQADYYDKLKQDSDFMPAEYFFTQRNYHLSHLSHELRLSGNANQAKWLLGLYADKTDNDLSFTNKTPLRLQTIDSNLEGRSLSLFGQWLQPVNSQWSITLGGRIEQDRMEIKVKNLSAQNKHWNQFSPRASLQYQWQAEQNLYLTYAEGFRAGGFNAFLPAGNYPAYSPEKVRSYESGIKGYIQPIHLRYAIAVYHMQINDMQVQQYLAPGVVSITNAATAHSNGVELTLDYRLNPQWSFDASIGLNKTRFNRYQDGNNNYDHNRNPYAPDLTWHIAVRYNAENWYANASLDGVGSTYLDPANKYRRGSYQLLYLSASYPINQHLTVSAYGRNVTNQRYDAVGFMNGRVTVYSPPREVGVKVSYEF